LDEVLAAREPRRANLWIPDGRDRPRVQHRRQRAVVSKAATSSFPG